MKLEEMQSLSTPEGCTLRMKQTFEYATPYCIYDVELFTNMDKSCFAIAVPRGTTKVVVYGSSITTSPDKALQMLFLKIDRESLEKPND